MSIKPFGHGTPANYKRGCRCAECSAAYAVIQRAYKRKRVKRMASGHHKFKHGLGGYLNWGCRCRVSRAANARHGQRRRHKKTK